MKAKNWLNQNFVCVANLFIFLFSREVFMNTFFNPRFTSEIFDAIDRNFSGMNTFPESPKKFIPKVDIREAKESYIIDMELAGFSENDVEIELKDRELSIFSKREKTCCHKTEKTDTEENISEPEKEVAPKSDRPEFRWLVKERGFGTKRFYRSFKLPEDIDEENVSANFKNGLLTISVPKKSEVKTRKIAIGA